MKALDDLGNFFLKLRHYEITGHFPAEVVAKRIGVECPELLKGHTVRPATKDDVKGPTQITFYSQNLTFFVRLLPFMGRTKCFVHCIEIGDSTYCGHVCITCFDRWPGPGCYVSYNYQRLE